VPKQAWHELSCRVQTQHEMDRLLRMQIMQSIRESRLKLITVKATMKQSTEIRRTTLEHDS
jgi:hypothetical protein